MATKAYAEYLKENGATEEEIKILDVPAARKVYDAQVKAAADAAADAADKAARLAAYDKWYNEVAEPTATQLKNERDVAKAEADAERARIKSLQEAGLIKLEEKKEAAAVATSAAPFDPKAHNLVTTDFVRTLADQEGDAIAIMADIQDEHRELFGTRINARELRAEAKKAGKSLEEIWLQKFDVPAKRAEKAAADKKKYEDELIERGRQEERSKQVNPLTRTPVPSSNPFTSAKRTGTDGKADVLPWQGNQDQRSNDRVNRALQNLQQKNII